MNATSKATSAILATLISDHKYLKTMLGDKLKSVPFKDVNELYSRLVCSKWEEFEYHFSTRGLTAFKTDLPGAVNVSRILSWDRLILTDPDKTGFVRAQFVRERNEEDYAEFSTLVCGEVDHELRALALHIGAPILPSTIPACAGLVGKRVTGEEAIALGLTLGEFGSPTDQG